MIARSRPNAAQLLYIMRGSVVPRILPRVLVIAVLSGLVVWLHRMFPAYFPNHAAAPFTLLGLDELGDELEEPFGLAQNDLPLNAMARKVEISLLETLGETEIPEALPPRNYRLH
jgi:predicted membrane chloride channel (bestrophin family)